MLEGLQYLHKLKIYHKNLKPSIILVDIDGTIKISDFLIDNLMLGDADDLYNILLKSDIINYYIHHFLYKQLINLNVQII